MGFFPLTLLVVLTELEEVVDVLLAKGSLDDNSVALICQSETKKIYIYIYIYGFDNMRKPYLFFIGITQVNNGPLGYQP